MTEHLTEVRELGSKTAPISLDRLAERLRLLQRGLFRTASAPNGDHSFVFDLEVLPLVTPEDGLPPILNSQLKSLASISAARKWDWREIDALRKTLALTDEWIALLATSPEELAAQRSAMTIEHDPHEWIRHFEPRFETSDDPRENGYIVGRESIVRHEDGAWRVQWFFTSATSARVVGISALLLLVTKLVANFSWLQMFVALVIAGGGLVAFAYVGTQFESAENDSFSDRWGRFR